MKNQELFGILAFYKENPMNKSEVQRQQCRVCLEEVKSYKYFSEPIDFRGDSAEPLDIFSAFTYCTHLEFEEQEAAEVIKQFICNSCINSLKFAYEFIKKARESDSSLRVIIEEYVDNENEEKYEPECIDETYFEEEEEDQDIIAKEEVEIIFDPTFPDQAQICSDGDESFEDLEQPHPEDIEVDTEEYMLEEIEEAIYEDDDESVPEVIMSDDKPEEKEELIPPAPPQESTKTLKPAAKKDVKKVKKDLKTHLKCKDCCEFDFVFYYFDFYIF